MPIALEPIIPSERDAKFASAGSQTLTRLLRQSGGSNDVHLRSSTEGADEITLPPGVAHLFGQVLEQVGRGQSVVVLPVESELTTSQAAEMIGVSRPFMVRLLEQGDIPFELVGTHRRVRLADVIAYRQEKARQRGVLDELVRDAQEREMGY